jgi:cyclopropane-fatty-acyl-phospholipid synthase
MSFAQRALNVAENYPLPRWMLRLGVFNLVRQTSRSLHTQHVTDADFAEAMRNYPIAEATDAANEQHYELPAAFFSEALGPRRKYSCCYYPTGQETLAEAEEHALALTCTHADLQDGQHILELGCGWGAITLYMAEHYPNAHITAVSNSHGQRAYIEAQLTERKLGNVRVITADMNHFVPEAQYDRIISVEMFEHMANWHGLFAHMHGWLKPEGRVFIHIFTHKNACYRFDKRNEDDWIAQHFFTGGIMPSHGLIHNFASYFAVEEEWRWDGRHYERTADHWLENYDAKRSTIKPILKRFYGKNAGVWQHRWRLFFLATSGLFGYDKGQEWGVSHYRLRKSEAA